MANGIPPGDPTFAGFQAFVTSVMAVPTNDMPDDTALQYAFDYAVDLTYFMLQSIPSQPTSPSIYAIAVYNLGGHWLVETAQDTPPSTYWTDLRTQFNINSFFPGIVQQASDQGTSEGSYIPDQLRNLTLMDLDLLKTPWGRMYLQISGQWGTIWGLTA